MMQINVSQQNSEKMGGNWIRSTDQVKIHEQNV